MIIPCVKPANTKIQTQNTEIHKYSIKRKCQKDPTCGIFLKRRFCRDTNYDVHMSQTRKYKITNTQISKYTNTANDKVP